MRSYSREETCTIARDFLNTISVSQKRATIVALIGDLGSGKTTFVQCVAKDIGVKENVTSPTFLIERAYPTEHSLFSHLVHVDAYRLENEKEMKTINWNELVEDPTSIIFVEWAEKIPSFMPQNHHTIQFTFIDETTRDIDITYASQKG